MKKQNFRSTKYVEVFNHTCAHEGCNLFGPFGYGPIKIPHLVHWYCAEHRPSGGAP